jgi:hypothetical protein
MERSVGERKKENEGTIDKYTERKELGVKI